MGGPASHAAGFQDLTDERAEPVLHVIAGLRTREERGPAPVLRELPDVRLPQRPVGNVALVRQEAHGNLPRDARDRLGPPPPEEHWSAGNDPAKPATSPATDFGSSPLTTTRAISSATSSISDSRIPSRVSSWLPRRTPEGFTGEVAGGRRFLFAMMFARSKSSATFAPPPWARTSTATMWDSVKPYGSARNRSPRAWRAVARAFAFRTTRSAY